VPQPVVAPAELSIAHTGASGGPAAGPRFRLFFRYCSQTVTVRDRYGVPVADRRSPAAATAVGPVLCPGASTRSDTGSALVKASGAADARIGAAAASPLAADGPDPTGQTLRTLR
jgi:hypothetical protein